MQCVGMCKFHCGSAALSWYVDGYESELPIWNSLLVIHKDYFYQNMLNQYVE